MIDEKEKEVRAQDIMVVLNDDETYTNLTNTRIVWRGEVYNLEAMVMDAMEEVPAAEAYHLGRVETSGIKIQPDNYDDFGYEEEKLDEDPSEEEDNA